MDAGLEQGDAQVGVVSVRRGDHGGVEAGGDEVGGRGEGHGVIQAGDALGRGGVRIKHRRQVEIADVGQDAGVVAAHDADAGDADLERGKRGMRHAVQPLYPATAAMIRSWVASSRSECIGRLTTRSISRSVTGRPWGPRGYMSYAGCRCSGIG